jgi:hypothetical protein
MLFAANVLVRLIYRGPYHTGWDLIGAADGLFRVNNFDLWHQVQDSFHKTRHFSYWNSTNSVIYSLVPGWLGGLWSTEAWPDVLVFLTFLATVTAIWFYYRDRSDQITPYLVALVCASAGLTTFSIVGYPYISGFLPHILALCWLRRSFVRQSVIWRLAIGTALAELTVHVYELGKTSFMIFLLAAALKQQWRPKDRLLALAVGAIHLVMVFWVRGTNVSHRLDVLGRDLGVFLESPVRFLWLLVKFSYDVPTVFVLAVLSLFFIKKEVRFLSGLLAFQWLLLFIELLHEGDVRPRRALVLAFYSIFLVLRGLTESDDRRFRVATQALLVAGIVWQNVITYRYLQTPIVQQRHPLPLTGSDADYFVNRVVVDEAAAFSAAVARSGTKLALFYDYDVYQENTTDPAGLPERLLLRHGYVALVSRLTFVGFRGNRYSRIPITEPEAFFADLASARLHWRFFIYRGPWSGHSDLPSQVHSRLVALGARPCPDVDARLASWVCLER